MKRILLAFVTVFISTVTFAQYPGDCWTSIEDLSAASVDELTSEYNRLKAAEIRYCDTTNSTFHNIMKEIGSQMVTEKTAQARAVELMGEPYWQGTAAEYENNKVSLVRGKVVGAVLPPMFEIPAGDSYVLYLWRGKDYLILSFKNGVAADSGWYRKQ